MLSQFRNCALTDFSKDENRKKMVEALEKIKKEFGKEYPIVIAGEETKYGRVLKSFNPSNREEVVGIVHEGDDVLAQKALDSAGKAFESWKQVPAGDRADYLLRAAKILKVRRLEFAAVMVYETGKNWIEADADVAEAIDFLEFYAREAVRWSAPQPIIPYPGEANELVYIPLGVGAVIPPWNFPCAILVGMASAAIAAGNTIILKPSSDAPVIGAKFVELMEEAGLPAGVLNFLPGSGRVVGEYLVNSPQTRFIAFTGSKEVGLGIVEKAGKHHPCQLWIKRVVSEMGGKDAIIVDSEADLNSAAKGVMVSAFGYQGQKCSACSRAIVVEDVYDEFLKKLIEETKGIKVGDVEDPSNFMGPVINQSAFDKIMSYIDIGRKEGKVVIGGDGDDGKGYFINPTIITEVPWDSRLAQEEVFGPVLAVIKAKDFDDALRIANSTEFGLTGAVYTKDKERIKKAKGRFFVGNLYINRKCTGALVGVQPFGGFNMSGTDSKAGGREYMLLFMQAKSMCEKL